ncbi:conserved phage C-terminal domain-containing protein [Paraburkholderia sediminicola]|uniref:conserved phage C-terminal domain-containing protein n=1 Tax=Paraburkholderia sediminicola TaxID=458836 RepID=UPI0038BC71D8
MSGKPDDANGEESEQREPELVLEASDPVAEIIGHLNAVVGANFRVVEASAKLIRARMREGATMDDLRAVVNAKNREWPKGHDMRKYLRPATLFNAEKFAQYLGQLGVAAAEAAAPKKAQFVW